MVKLTMLIGIQGSGKSTWSEEHIKKVDNTIIISTDKIRKELFGEINGEVEKTMNEVVKRVKTNLENGINVIYDATNLNSKKRKNFLKNFSKIEGLRKEAIFFPEELYVCLDRNHRRQSHTVPIQKINQVYLSCQVPMYHEGWDRITYHITINNMNLLREQEPYEEIYDLTYQKFKRDILSEIAEENIELPQDNPHHCFSVSRHMYVAYEELLKENKEVSEDLILATLLHDVGKAFCKRFKEGSKYATFYSHENVSAYLVTNYMLRRGYSDNDITYVTTLIQLHSRFFNIKNKEDYHKLHMLLGTDMYNELYLLNKVDKLAK